MIDSKDNNDYKRMIPFVSISAREFASGSAGASGCPSVPRWFQWWLTETFTVRGAAAPAKL